MHLFFTVHYPDVLQVGGGRVVRWYWVNFGRLTNLDKSEARANCAYSRRERGLFGRFF